MTQDETTALIATIAGQLVVHGRRIGEHTIKPMSYRDAFDVATDIVRLADDAARKISSRPRSLSDE